MNQESNYFFYKDEFDKLMRIPNNIKNNPSYFRSLLDLISNAINNAPTEDVNLAQLREEIKTLLNSDHNDCFPGSTAKKS